MYPSPSILRSENCEGTVGAKSTLARIVKEMTPHIGGVFRVFATSLHESRRREASRLIRQYRRLIDKSAG